MDTVQVLDIMRGAFGVAAKVSAPILISALVIGVAISLVQTVTQIQEMTLTFVPKLVAAGLIILFLGGWMLTQITEWITQLWGLIPSLL
jgi:flagellar biosynthetic protein FliQ